MLRKIAKLVLGDESVREARRTVRALQNTAAERGHIRDRERRKLEDARAITRRHFLQVLTVGGALLVGGGSIGLNLWPKRRTKEGSIPIKSPHVPDTQQEIPQLTPEQIQTLIKYQQERKRWTLDTLEKFKDTNDKTRQLFEMLKKHAFYTIPLGPRVTQQIIAGDARTDSLPNLFSNDEHSFEVVFMPEEFAHTLLSSVVWESHERTFRIAADFENPDWFAAVGYHELGHVWDQLWGGENPDDPAQWTDGEVRAHQVECEVLQRWKPVEYAEFLRQTTSHWRTRNTKEIIAIGDRLFPSPGRSQRAQAIASGALIACAAFESARQDGKDLKRVYREEILTTHQGYR